MTNKIKYSYVCSLIVSVVIAIAASALRASVLLTAFDDATGGFDPTPLYDAFLILLAVTVLLVIVPLVLLRTMNNVKVVYDDIPTIFASAFMLVSLVMYVIHTVIEAANKTHAGTSAFIFSLLSAVLALASCAYFVTVLLTKKPSPSSRSVLAVLNVLFACIFALFLYTENQFFITSPVKALHILSAVLIAFFFVGECRICLDRTIWNLYLCVAFPAFIITACDAVSCLIYIPVKTSEEIGSSAYCFLILAYSLYILCRLISIYLSNCKNAKGLLAVFDASTSRKSNAEAIDSEQLSMDIDSASTKTEE
jgi:hypothetical protein